MPWFVLALILYVGSNVAPLSDSVALIWAIRCAISICLIRGIWKVCVPSAAIIIDDECLSVKGVRPGWWNLFQRWTWIVIRDSQVVDVRIGKIREAQSFGLKLPPLGEPSKGRMFQSFLWIRYHDGTRNAELYYPEIWDISGTEVLVRRLKEKFQDKVTVFNKRT